MGQCEVPYTNTCGEAQARYVVGRENPYSSLA